ncbi:hypothetical protein CHS0354_042159 [Potamilus streckersoni]|uniref:Uncharacterized protein n=1 Tax=Potamilus streckersoni TaxID=2493646 RepID=A0AAE0TM18_9BIVA|nr:hypothetical protein CHS0354_042159 [Potamilus streckersoni]
MHYLLHLALLSAVLVQEAQGDIIDDPCQIMPQGPPDEHTTIDEQADSMCHNGTFWWNYPRGSIRLHFQHKASPYFRVCLKDYLVGSIFKLYDVTSDMKHAMPSVTPESSNEVCTSAHHYEIIILFEAPKHMLYMGEVAYRIQPIFPI